MNWVVGVIPHVTLITWLAIRSDLTLVSMDGPECIKKIPIIVSSLCQHQRLAADKRDVT